MTAFQIAVDEDIVEDLTPEHGLGLATGYA